MQSFFLFSLKLQHCTVLLNFQFTHSRSLYHTKVFSKKVIGKVDQKRQNERDLEASVNEPYNNMVL